MLGAAAVLGKAVWVCRTGLSRRGDMSLQSSHCASCPAWHRFSHITLEVKPVPTSAHQEEKENLQVSFFFLLISF